MEAFLESPGTTLLIALGVGVALALPTFFALARTKLPPLVRNTIVAADFAVVFALTVYFLPAVTGG